MKQYAWKIEGPNGAVLEGTSSLSKLEAVLEQSALPCRLPPPEIISLTSVMQCDGQGIYRHRAPGEEWTLLWIELR
jgi:hypothetical protein